LVGSHRNVFPARTRASSSSLYSRKIVDDMFTETSNIVQYYIGTMIEIPRAALVVDEVRIKVLFLMHMINKVDKIE
jgi:phosphoenolpyruvate-protein kinase (PTS system EI component)